MVLIEEVVEVKGGYKVVIECCFFFGYVFVEMEMMDEMWYFVKNMVKVIGFVGGVCNCLILIFLKEVEKIML